MDINEVKYVLVGDYISPVVISDDDEVLDKFSLEERAKIYIKCAYYERLIQTIKDEKKDWIFDYCNYDLSDIDGLYSYIKTYEKIGSNKVALDTSVIATGVLTKNCTIIKACTINNKTNDLDKKRYVTARDNLVNNFVSGTYSLEVIYKTFNEVTKTTNVKKIEFYPIDTYIREYYDLYDTDVPQQRYTVEELRKIISEKIDSANNYEFDGSSLIYNSYKRVILTLYV